MAPSNLQSATQSQEIACWERFSVSEGGEKKRKRKTHRELARVFLFVKSIFYHYNETNVLEGVNPPQR